MAAITIVDGSRTSAREQSQHAKAIVTRQEASAQETYISESASAAQPQHHATVVMNNQEASATQSYIFGGLSYDGPYEVTPTIDEQTLSTSRRTLRNDVTVHSIPYHATSNDSGGITVSIAS